MKTWSVLLGLWGLAAVATPLAPTEEAAKQTQNQPPPEAEAQPQTQPQLTKNPSLLESSPAVFPPEMEAEQKSGTVVLELEIDEEGDVKNVLVLESAGPAFDKAAVEAAWKYRFSPAEVDGKPAPVRIHYRSEFFFRPQVETTPSGSLLGELSGELVERGTRAPLIQALIVLGEGETAQETFSDKEGRFSFPQLPPGKWKLSVSSPEHERFTAEETTTAGERTQVRYFILKKTYGAFQTTVRGTKDKREVSQVSLQQEEIRLIPGTQGDAFKVVLNLPGVARSVFSMGMLVVRGSRPSDTRVYVDDVHIPLLFHFGGLYSTVNPALLERLDFEPGSFGVAYGRSTGGLIKGNIRPLSSEGLHGYVDINLPRDASALLEGPVGNGWSVLASGRRSYLDVFLPLFVPADTLKFTTAPRYYDYQLRAEHLSQDKKSRFFVFIFGSDDKMKLLSPNATDLEGRNSFGNTLRFVRLAIGWERRFSDKLFFKTRNSIGYDNAKVSMGDDMFMYGSEYPINSRNEFSFTFSENTTLRTGMDFAYKPISAKVQMPNFPKANQIPDPMFSRQLVSSTEKYHFFEPALYAEVQHSPFEGFQVVGGLRADYNSHINKAWVDPRLAISYAFAERFKLKGALGLFHQPPNYLNGQVSSVFGNPNLKPERSVHSSVGLEVNITKAIDLDIQFYAKNGFNISRLTSGGDSQSNLNVADTTKPWDNSGSSRAYGMEILLRHQLTDRFFGWIAYSLSRSERNNILQGGYRRSSFDQPHNLIVVASYKLPLDFVLGAKLQYVSGNTSTPVVGAIFDANSDSYHPLNGYANSTRMPDFFQLDVRLDKRFVFQKWMLSLYLDVQNVTNRKNPETPIHNYDYTQSTFLSGLPILPTIGIRGEF
ncbi:MAG: TonB-dependent receptor [Proteobacteria bacterium]|nr:TonB-dependent receptor [Cystobacterineae bacterium]MCL2258465.1 TonB-dependent receptor [Cystobacterineae bacterium]MCL2315195.1 TonB-dependent receptor [Pseudomonadota bacterium]